MFAPANIMDISVKVGRSLLRHLKQASTYSVIIFSLFLTNVTFAAQPLRIAVSSNFAPVLKQLLPQFNQQTGIATQAINGVTGGLYQQIKHGAPYDIFLAADSLHPQKLAQDNLIIIHSRKTYALGQLALYSTERLNITWKNLANILGDKSKRLAIANPKTAPYGKAAKQCLIKQSLWPLLKNKLIIGNNIGQTFQQVRSQAVFIGIVAYSQLKLNKLTGNLLPASCYTPINQQLVILKNTQQAKSAQLFSDFLLSKKTQQQIAQWGYLTGHKLTSEKIND